MATQHNNSTTAGGLGVILLTIAFFTAKVLGYIDWSWWLVFSPLLVSGVLFIAAVLFLIWAAKQ